MQRKGLIKLDNERIFYGDVILGENELRESSTKYPIKLEYYKRKTKRMSFNNEAYEIYGIEIVKKEYQEKQINLENKTIENVTKNEKLLNKIIKMLKDNTVTPMGLSDVLHDLFNKNESNVAFCTQRAQYSNEIRKGAKTLYE